MELTRDDLLAALAAINPNCERKRWIAAGLACHDAGLSLDDWDRWSANAADVYPGRKQIVAQWKSICRTAKAPAGSNLAPLIALAQSEGWKPPKRGAKLEFRQRLSLPASANPSARSRESHDGMPDAKRDALIACVLSAARPATRDHEYLARKDIEPNGLLCVGVDTLTSIIGYVPSARDEKLDGDILIAPLFAPETGEIQAVEFIDAAGRKSGLAGVKRGGLVWCDTGAMPAPYALIGIAEGVATACSAQSALRLLPQYTDAVVFAASSSGNLKAVAARMRALRPTAEIVVFGDSGNGSQSAIDAADLVSGIAVIPDAGLLSAEGAKDWNDACAHMGYAKVALHLAEALRDPTIITFPRTESDLLPLNFHLPGLPVGGVGMIAGPGAVGKTFLVMQMAIGLVFGRSCLGEHLPRDWYAPQRDSADALPLRVGMILGEDDAPIIQRREFDIGDVYEITPKQRDLLDRNLHVHAMVGHDLRVVQVERYGHIGPGPFMPHLRRICSQHDIVIVDPLVRLHDSQENDNTAASALITALSRIGRETCCTILLLHHFGKTGGTDRNAARGASAYSTSVRWQANLVPLTLEEESMIGVHPSDYAQHIKLDLTKANYIAPRPPLVFRRGEHGVLHATRHTLASTQALPFGASASGLSRKVTGIPERRILDPSENPFE